MPRRYLLCVLINITEPQRMLGTISAKRSEDGWCPRQESNLYLKLRRLAVYPLTYEGTNLE